jgi:hypothetical protein
MIQGRIQSQYLHNMEIILLSIGVSLLCVSLIYLHLRSAWESRLEDVEFRDSLIKGDQAVIVRASGIMKGKVVRITSEKVCLTVPGQGLVWAKTQELFPDQDYEGEKRNLNLSIYKFIKESINHE